MIGKVPRHRSYADDIDPDAMFVFIPGAIASGFLVSMGLVIGDAMRSLRGTGGVRRRITLTGAALAEETRSGAGAARRLPHGLRRRAFYGIFGAASLGLVTGAIPGVVWNFLSPGGYVSNISWMWAVSMLAVLVFAVGGVQALRLAPEWVPITIVVVGLGVLARFAFGPEPAAVRLIVVIVDALLASALTAATWRLRHRRTMVDVPASVRPLLAATPLGTPLDAHGRGE